MKSVFSKSRIVIGSALTSALFLTGCGRNTGSPTPIVSADLAETTAPSADVTVGKGLFEANCVACHSIGEGIRVGPDLVYVTQRRDPEWLANWIEDPIGMAHTDSLAMVLIAESNGIQMAPNQLNRDQIGQVLEYIKWAGAFAPTELFSDSGPQQ